MQPELKATLAERQARYGDFSDHSIIAQGLQDLMRNAEADGIRGWDKLSPDKKQALTVIADKIARILTGDPEYYDNWHDLQGYAKLAEDRCKKDEPNANPTTTGSKEAAQAVLDARASGSNISATTASGTQVEGTSEAPVAVPVESSFNSNAYTAMRGALLLDQPA